MHGGQFRGFRLSFDVSPCDFREWLHGIHDMNELSVNTCPRDVGE